MGGRELKEDILKIQKATNVPYEQCLEAFVLNKHNVDKTIEFLKWKSEFVLFKNEQNN